MPTITARQAAEQWGVSESMARRILASTAAHDRDVETGAKLYAQEDADVAYASRPGRGARLDLTVTKHGVVTQDQLEELTSDEAHPVAHRALWALLWDGDLRLGDALSLDVRDIDYENGTALVDFPKRESDPRSVPVAERALGLVRAAAGDRSEGPLLLNRSGRPLSREQSARVAQDAAGVSIHAFRTGGELHRRQQR